MDDISVLLFAFYRIVSNVNQLGQNEEVSEQALARLRSIFDDFNEDEIRELL